MEDFERVKQEDYVEDEFGIALKGYIGLRAIFYLLCTFAVLGAAVALLFGATTINDLVSNATGFDVTTDYITGSAFGGLKTLMFIQAGYTIAALAVTVLFYIKRNKLFAFIDIGLFVVFAALFFVFGTFDLFKSGVWVLYFLLNPIWSFIALFAGKHFAYMPMK